MQLVIAYVAALVTVAVLDFIWLGYIARDFYRASIGHLMAENVNVPAAVAFYLLYPVGLLLFAVNPALVSGDWQKAAFLGAAFGFFAYATYDLSNLATLKQWPLAYSLTDIAWGTALSACTASVCYWAASRFG